MLNVQKYLQEYGLESLKNEYNITSNMYDDCVSLNYTIESPKFHPITDECRGLILDRNDWSILSKGFTRFYNDFEHTNLKEYDFQNCRVYEKIDGSYISVWWNPHYNCWMPSTRKMAHAEGSVASDPNSTFYDLVEQVFKNIQTCFNDLNKDRVYIFELVSPLTRVIKYYPTTKMYLLTMVDRNRLYDFQYDYEALWHVAKILTENIEKQKSNFHEEQDSIEVVRQYDANSFDEIKEKISMMSEQDEGFVCALEVEPGKIWRVKIKNPKHVALSVMKNNGVLSQKDLVKMVWTGEYTEYCHYFPEYEDIFIPYLKVKDKIIEDVKTVWNKLKVIEEQKDFAQEVCKRPKYIQCFMFGLRKGHDIDSVFDDMLDTSKVKVFREVRNLIERG